MRYPIFNLFNALESTKGETMAVAALRYLLMRNRPLREQFFYTLGKSVSHSLYDNFEYFGCELEVPCREDGSLDTGDIVGRIDMIVESKSAVVGIEAKLGHRISNEQLLKYIPELKRRKDLLNSLRGLKTDMHLVLLVPAWQRQKAEEETKLAFDVLNGAEQHDDSDLDTRTIRIVTWEDTLQYMQQAASDTAMTTEDKFVLDTLENYIGKWSGQTRNFSFSWEAAYHEFVVGNPMPQKEIVTYLSQFFPTGNSSISTTDNYVGYNFSPDFTKNESLPWDKVRWGWFGFIRNTYLKDIKNREDKYQSAFCLFTDYLPDNMDIKQITMHSSADISGKLSAWYPEHDKYLWIFDKCIIDEYDMKDPAIWYDILKPFLIPGSNSSDYV